MDTRMLKRVLLGLALVGLGGLFFAAELGYIELSVGQLVSTYWPVILMYVGLSGMIDNLRPERRNSGSMFWSFFILALGGMFLARNLGLTRLSIGDFVQLMIPAAIILIGIRMVFKRSKVDKEPVKEQEQPYKYEYKYEFNPGPKSPYFPDDASQPPPAPEPAPEPASRPKQQYDVPPRPRPSGHAHSSDYSTDYSTDYSSDYEHSSHSHDDWHYQYDGSTENRSGLIGDLHLGQDHWEVRPKNVSHFIGDTIIDLTRAHIPYGETKLNVSAFIGDVKVFVPSDIDLEISVSSSSFIGDIEVFDRSESGMLRSMRYEPAEYGSAEKRIRLIVNMFIGDVSIKRVG